MVRLLGPLPLHYVYQNCCLVCTNNIIYTMLDFADMFYMNASNSRGSVYGAVSVLSGGSAGISLMKSDRRKSRKQSASEYLLKRRVGSFGP